MLAEIPARGIRVGETNVAPGEARVLSISLSPRALSPRAPSTRAGGDRAAAKADDKAGDKAARVAVPAWVAVGPRAGPRVSVVAAVHGFEAAATRAATQLVRGIDPAAISGSLVIVPVMRIGGRFSPGERAAPTWKYPGDAGGDRRERDAFALFSAVVVGSTALIVLGSPPAGRRAVSSVRGDLDDPRTRRMALESGVSVALSVRGGPGTLGGAAADAGVSAIELRAEGASERESADVEQLVSAVRAVLLAIGLLPINAAARQDGKPSEGRLADARTARAAAAPPLLITRSSSVRAPTGGLVDAVVGAGELARRGGLMARIAPPLGGKPIEVRARREGMILESPRRLTARTRTKLFTIGTIARTDAGRAASFLASARASDVAGADADADAGPRTVRRRAVRAPATDAKIRAGWVEHVGLPNLGIARLKAKIDTGARTSALHVARMKVVGTSGGLARRPILEIAVPGGGPRGTRPIKVRAAVRDYVVVRDTSGRMEKRPVIETTLLIGPFKKRILVTLTNRGDMLFPMLIGRTALGAGIVVDPSRRYLLSIS